MLRVQESHICSRACAMLCVLCSVCAARYCVLYMIYALLCSAFCVMCDIRPALYCILCCVWYSPCTALHCVFYMIFVLYCPALCIAHISCRILHSVLWYNIFYSSGVDVGVDSSVSNLFALLYARNLTNGNLVILVLLCSLGIVLRRTESLLRKVKIPLRDFAMILN